MVNSIFYEEVDMAFLHHCLNRSTIQFVALYFDIEKLGKTFKIQNLLLALFHTALLS